MELQDIDGKYMRGYRQVAGYDLLDFFKDKSVPA